MKKAGPIEWLWAPWRMPYIKKAGKSDRAEDCFFCRYARQKRDRRNLVLLRGKKCFVVMNRFPYTSGHVMVAPMAHVSELEEFSGAVREEFFDLLLRIKGAIRRALRPHGFNIGVNLGRAAGAGVLGHVHLHIVPRWNGDTNFMTSVSHARVIPQALEALYEQLQKALRNGR